MHAPKPNLSRAVLPWSARDRHLPWIERSASEVEESARRYARRLAAAKKSYGYLRWHGTTCAPDITHVQAARRKAEDKLVRDIDKNTPRWTPKEHRLWVFIWALLFEPPWFVISILALLNITSRQRELCPRWYAFDRGGGLTWHHLTEGEVLSCEALELCSVSDSEIFN